MPLVDTLALSPHVRDGFAEVYRNLSRYPGKTPVCAELVRRWLRQMARDLERQRATPRRPLADHSAGLTLDAVRDAVRDAMREVAQSPPPFDPAETWAEQELARAHDESLPQPKPIGGRALSLLSFLVKRGGLQDEGGELRAMDARRARVGLVRKGPAQRVKGQGTVLRIEAGAAGDAKRFGMKLDEARGAAEEAGYLRQDSTINDLLDAIRCELGGRRVYPPEIVDPNGTTYLDAIPF